MSHLPRPTTDLGNLGGCYADLGQITRAIESYERALIIARDIGDRAVEAHCLANLGGCYAGLGQITRAIESYERALIIARDIGERRVEAHCLGSLGECHAVLGEWDRAAGYQRRAIDLADEIGFAPTQSEARLGLATTLLFAEDLPSAQQTAAAARDHSHPPAQPGIALVTGIIRLRQHSPTTATQAFREAIDHAHQQLRDTTGNYAALDTTALAHTGLTLVDHPDHAAQAIEAFRAARAITTAAGIVDGVLRLFDALTVADPTGVLQPIRPVAAGAAPT